MCGIIGTIDYTKNINEISFNIMRDIIDYRGPDDFGTEFFEKETYTLALGHRRLSIQDLSPLGHQPMNYENLHIIFNGEVYNFEEIKRELLELNYTFTSHSDTEVILKAYHAWGVKCVDKFRGMFAFAIYDESEESLTIFRDRAGVKPLYYYKTDSEFIFGSELKSLYQYEHFQKVLNKKALPFYFRFGYIPAPLTIFENTFKLKPGHYIKYDINTKQFEEKKYWDVKEHYQAHKMSKSEDETLQELEEILQDSFALRMVSDVPVGVFLSGGVDSSLVAALLQKSSNKPLKTFTIGFEDKKYDESTFAKDIATHLGTDHTEYICTPKDMQDVIEELSFMYDEPFGDSSAIPTYLVSKVAKEKVKVALSGDGGDEAFVGYSKYFALEKISNMSAIKKTILKIVVNSLNERSVTFLNKQLPVSRRQRNIKDKFRKFKNAINSSDVYEMFINASSYVSDDLLSKILQNNTIEFKNTFFGENISSDILSQMQMLDYKTFMVDDVLTKVDRASMMTSLEAREPLLDHKIIEYAAKIPSALKYKNKDGKYLLKKILYKYVPKELIERPKSGFQIPLDEWLKNDLKYLVVKYISKENLDEDIFDISETIKLRDAFLVGKSSDFSIIWFLMMFGMWREKWNI